MRRHNLIPRLEGVSLEAARKIRSGPPSVTRRPRLGVMQGRLVEPRDGLIQSFPERNWREEFPRAARLGLDCIEWIYDALSEGNNPLASESGIEEVAKHSEESAVAVASVCADYFMEKPFRGPTAAASRGRLEWLIERCRRAGIMRIVLPFVDRSAIASAREGISVAAMLAEVIPSAVQASVELHLETSLGPQEFASLLERLPVPAVKVNYDTGNSASNGYSPLEEFSSYGERVGSVHIKDRVRGGPTVPLGEGDTDFRQVFSCLRNVGYSGDFILQAARGPSGEELPWVRASMHFLEDHLDF